MKPKMLITLLMLLMVLSAFSPVQAAQTPKDKPHEKWTMHVGEEETYVFPYSIATTCVHFSFDENYISERAYRDEGWTTYWTIKALQPGNTTVRVDYYHLLPPFCFTPDTVEYYDIEILP